MPSFALSIFLLFNLFQETSKLDKILEKHYGSINYDELKLISSLEMEGAVDFYLDKTAFESQSPSLSGRFREIIKRPDQRYYESSFNNVDGTFQQAYNGKEKWGIDGGGLKVQELNEKAYLESQLSFDVTPNLYRLEERGFEAFYLGKLKLDDHQYYCIKLIHEHGTHFYYLDLRTYLVRIIAFQDENVEDTNWNKRHYDDYKRIGDIMFSHTQYEKMNVYGNETTMIFKYEDIQLNNNIDPRIFNIPEIP